MPNESVLIFILVLVIATIALILRQRAQTAGVVQVSAPDATSIIQSGATFIDVRTPEEYRNGHARGARLVPLDQLSSNLGKISKNRPVVVICASGNRSAQAARQLTQAGYEHVVSVRGGTGAWRRAGLPME